MFKLARILVLLSFLPVLAMSCTATPSAVMKATPTPTPTPIVFATPDIPTPTPVPQATPSCVLWVIHCTTPTPVPCQSHYVYDDLVNMGTSWIVINQQQDQNNTTSPIPAKFTSTTSKAVEVTDQLNMISTTTNSESISEGDISVTVTNSVSTEINHSVSRSVTTTIGNSTTVSVPPGKTGYGNYGVKVQITDGRLYDQTGCEGANSYFGPDITYVPFATGWCVWISGQSPCPSVQP